MGHDEPDMRVEPLPGDRVLLVPVTGAGRRWAARNGDPDAGGRGAFAIQAEHLDSWLEGMAEDGLRVERRA